MQPMQPIFPVHNRIFEVLYRGCLDGWHVCYHIATVAI